VRSGRTAEDEWRASGGMPSRAGHGQRSAASGGWPGRARAEAAGTGRAGHGRRWQRTEISGESKREWGGAQALNYLTTFRCGGVSPVKKNTENN
jgi:hypothetical protein